MVCSVPGVLRIEHTITANQISRFLIHHSLTLVLSICFKKWAYPQNLHMVRIVIIKLAFLFNRLYVRIYALVTPVCMCVFHVMNYYRT